jgi:hypothetical protein
MLPFGGVEAEAPGAASRPDGAGLPFIRGQVTRMPIFCISDEGTAVMSHGDAAPRLE